MKVYDFIEYFSEHLNSELANMIDASNPAIHVVTI